MRRLLMMYDDHGIRAALTVVLERGFDVTTAATASEGLYRLTGLSPDLVVLDMATLDLDPAAFLSGLRARRSGCPVIVVNADGRAPGIAELTALALDGLLFKPFELDKLLERIDSVLGARGAGRLCPPFRSDARGALLDLDGPEALDSLLDGGMGGEQTKQAPSREWIHDEQMRRRRVGIEGNALGSHLKPLQG